jgi:hypothetical protein
MKPLSGKQLFFYSKNKLVILLYNKNVKKTNLLHSTILHLFFFIWNVITL